jgi:phosphopantetheinyl transferase
VTETNVKLFEFSFRYEKKEERGALAAVRFGEFSTEDAEMYLSDYELKRMRSIGCEKVRNQYFFGRVAAKKAVGLLADESEYRSLVIENDKFGCPTIENCDYSVSLTHTSGIAVGLACGKRFAFGIDVEEIRANRWNALKRVTSPKEPISNDLRSLTAIWTLKESLGKALKCGFRVPFEEFELSELSGNGEFFSCSYAKHPEFSGWAVIIENTSYAATFPRELLPNLSAPNFADQYRLAKKFRNAMVDGGYYCYNPALL